jgi:hypothetical protein
MPSRRRRGSTDRTTDWPQRRELCSAMLWEHRCWLPGALLAVLTACGGGSSRAPSPPIAMASATVMQGQAPLAVSFDSSKVWSGFADAGCKVPARRQSVITHVGDGRGRSAQTVGSRIPKGD